MGLYPLKFEPIYKAKVWGGRTLQRKLGRRLPGEAGSAEGKIGESWEIADVDSTSPSGGGGGAERSVVANGEHAGRTLHELIAAHGAALVGTLPLAADAHGAKTNFPLLVKYLDARENLSVQVHPSEAYAAEHDDAHLKSEAWYIVDAEPGAVIYKGVQEGVTAEQFAAAIEAGGLEDLMIAVEAKPGDCHYLPSGTCHALGAGILVAEVQTPSDTTFRVYDWGRTGRELHIEQALRCIAFRPVDEAMWQPRTKRGQGGVQVEALVQCDYFRIERVQAEAGYEGPITLRDQPQVWMWISGSGRIATSGGGLNQTPLERGETLLLPASLAEPRVTVDEAATWLEVTFPQATRHLIA